MSERTPEWTHMNDTLVDACDDRRLSGRDTAEGPLIWWDDGVAAALAAPLEAANKRVRELERELGERKLEDHLDTASIQKQNAELREAVRVLAKNLAEYAMCRHVNGNEWINCASDEVNANPTARSAIEAAAKETKQ
jgi:hypothetical protein